MEEKAPFEICLPQVYDAEEAPGAEAVCTPGATGSETILVVEDEEILLEVIQRVLQRYGYRVLTAHHGLEAIELCERYPAPINLMLTDVVMPHQNGRELAEHISLLRPEMKILFMSGYTEDAIMVRAVQDAAMPFLQKPFPCLDLVHKVRELIDGSRDWSASRNRRHLIESKNPPPQK